MCHPSQTPILQVSCTIAMRERLQNPREGEPEALFSMLVIALKISSAAQTASERYKFPSNKARTTQAKSKQYKRSVQSKSQALKPPRTQLHRGEHNKVNATILHTRDREKHSVHKCTQVRSQKPTGEYSCKSTKRQQKDKRTVECSKAREKTCPCFLLINYKKAMPIQ